MSASNEPFIVKSYVDFNRTKLIDADGKYHEKIDIGVAKRMAQERGLDLVCFCRPSGVNLALCKIINFGKWKYEAEKAKKKNENQNKKSVREVRFSPLISDNDIAHKVKQVIGFLEDGDDVVLSMRMHGRQKHYFDDAEAKLNDIIKLCGNHCKETNRFKASDMINARLSYSKEVVETKGKENVA